jgi:hypothetical protein
LFSLAREIADSPTPPEFPRAPDRMALGLSVVGVRRAMIGGWP